jgi:hypothetical protein
VPGNDWEVTTRELAIENVKVGPAYAACSYLDADLTGAGLTFCEFHPLERASNLGQHHCLQQQSP